MNRNDKNKKFTPLNINNVFKVKTVDTQNKTTYRAPGMQNIGKVSSMRRVPAPKWVPSIKSESGVSEPKQINNPLIDVVDCDSLLIKDKNQWNSKTASNKPFFLMGQSSERESVKPKLEDLRSRDSLISASTLNRIDALSISKVSKGDIAATGWAAEDDDLNLDEETKCNNNEEQISTEDAYLSPIQQFQIQTVAEQRNARNMEYCAAIERARQKKMGKDVSQEEVRVKDSPVDMGPPGGPPILHMGPMMHPMMPIMSFTQPPPQFTQPLPQFTQPPPPFTQAPMPFMVPMMPTVSLDHMHDPRLMEKWLEFLRQQSNEAPRNNDEEEVKVERDVCGSIQVLGRPQEIRETRVDVSETVWNEWEGNTDERDAQDTTRPHSAQTQHSDNKKVEDSTNMTGEFKQSRRKEYRPTGTKHTRYNGDAHNNNPSTLSTANNGYCHKHTGSQNNYENEKPIENENHEDSNFKVIKKDDWSGVKPKKNSDNRSCKEISMGFAVNPKETKRKDNYDSSSYNPRGSKSSNNQGNEYYDDYYYDKGKHIWDKYPPDRGPSVKIPSEKHKTGKYPVDNNSSDYYNSDSFRERKNYPSDSIHERKNDSGNYTTEKFHDRKNYHSEKFHHSGKYHSEKVYENRNDTGNYPSDNYYDGKNDPAPDYSSHNYPGPVYHDKKYNSDKSESRKYPSDNYHPKGFHETRNYSGNGVSNDYASREHYSQNYATKVNYDRKYSSDKNDPDLYQSEEYSSQHYRNFERRNSSDKNSSSKFSSQNYPNQRYHERNEYGMDTYYQTKYSNEHSDKHYPSKNSSHEYSAHKYHDQNVSSGGKSSKKSIKHEQERWRTKDRQTGKPEENVHQTKPNTNVTNQLTSEFSLHKSNDDNDVIG